MSPIAFHGNGPSARLAAVGEGSWLAGQAFLNNVITPTVPVPETSQLEPVQSSGEVLSK